MNWLRRKYDGLRLCYGLTKTTDGSKVRRVVKALLMLCGREVYYFSHDRDGHRLPLIYRPSKNR